VDFSEAFIKDITINEKDNENNNKNFNDSIDCNECSISRGKT